MKIIQIPDFAVHEEQSEEIARLLSVCFPDHKDDYRGRDYFKQLPHHRLLAFNDNELIGHLGIDFRVMNLNGNPVRVFGALDLCVSPEHRRTGIATGLLQRFEDIARDSCRVDFLFLVSNDPGFYERRGYKKTILRATWLKIDQHSNFGVATEDISDASFMQKSVSNAEWTDGKLDLLGYMY